MSQTAWPLSLLSCSEGQNPSAREVKNAQLDTLCASRGTTCLLLPTSEAPYGQTLPQPVPGVWARTQWAVLSQGWMASSSTSRFIGRSVLMQGPALFLSAQLHLLDCRGAVHFWLHCKERGCTVMPCQKGKWGWSQHHDHGTRMHLEYNNNVVIPHTERM